MCICLLLTLPISISTNTNFGLGEGKLYGRKEDKIRLVAKGLTQTYVIDYEEGSREALAFKCLL